MSNNKQALELTDITAPLLPATQGFTMKDRDASSSTPIIDETMCFLLDCAKKGENLGNQRRRPPSICKVSRILRDLNESLFIPQLVSIGPIHREDPKLKEFEWLKQCYLDDLLKRCHDSTPKETILEACLLKVNFLIPNIRESYDAGIFSYSDVDLAKMIVMDGCFILEFCFKHEEEKLYLQNKMQNTRIAMDLILLENQVPFFVLQALFDCLAPYIFKKNVTLSQVLDTHLAPYIKLFREKKSTTDVDSHLPEKISTIDVESDSTPAHVLGYLHKLYQPVVAMSSNPIHAEASKLVDEELAAKSWNPVEAEASKLVDEELAAKSWNPHTIVELDRSGMNFKPHQEDEWSMTIKFQSTLFSSLPLFWGKPTLLMPTLLIEDTTELILRNFIAYEQSFPHNCYYFTSYAKAMSMLIDTQEDIAKLVESKVLLNALGSNQEAADMINKLCKNISITEFYYNQEFKQVDKYYNGYWPKNIAWLKRDPETVNQFLMFYLNVLQTLYTSRAA